MEEMVNAKNVSQALVAVARNKGACGIDGMRCEELKGHLERHWDKIRSKLLEGRYVPTPVRRVEIPKEGGKRILGIPTVLDRFIQQLILQGMTPIFDLGFSKHSYGF